MKLTTIGAASALALALALAFGGFAVAAETAQPNPTATDRAGARVGNEIDQAVGPNVPITKAELATAISLNKVDNPAQSLSTAQIKNHAGQAVGTVSSVDVTPEGKAKAIHADVGGFLGMGEHTVALNADNLTYLKTRNLLVTNLSKAQIEALPQESPAH